jgi:hypothetical protein
MHHQNSTATLPIPCTGDISDDALVALLTYGSSTPLPGSLRFIAFTDGAWTEMRDAVKVSDLPHDAFAVVDGCGCVIESGRTGMYARHDIGKKYKTCAGRRGRRHQR